MWERLKEWKLDTVRGVYYLRHAIRQRINYRAGMAVDAQVEFYENIWRMAAEHLGATFVSLGRGFFEVRRKESVTRMWRNNVMLDNPVLLQIARDKTFSTQLMVDGGLPVPGNCEFRLKTIDKARAFLLKENSDCVVKPARGTGGGLGVTTHVRTWKDLKRAALHASLFSPQLLIERQIPGESYRLLYLDGRLLDAVKRGAPRVIGDGKSTIRSLIETENLRRIHGRGFTAQSVIALDLDCFNTLQRAGLSLDTVPKAGEEVVVKRVSNQSSNSDGQSVRSIICESLVRSGAKAASVVGLRLAGVDVITTDCRLSLEESGGVINEVNVSPGFHFHYQVHRAESHVPVAVPILRCLLGMDNVPGEAVEIGEKRDIPEIDPAKNLNK